MAGSLTVDFERVARFALPRTGATLCLGMRAMGYERDGRVVAGFLLEGYDGCNVWAHAAFDGPHDLNRSLLRALLRYVFMQLACARLWARVGADNARCIKFVEHMGARCVAVLPLAQGQCDVRVYCLGREDAPVAFL